MKFVCIDSYKQRKARLDGKWVRWFAWYPVSVGDQDCRWLEYVERRIWFFEWVRAIREVEYRPTQGKPAE
jgi:hypothetical protein